jgi:ABC-2 type transport system ATP-binding protein
VIDNKRIVGARITHESDGTHTLTEEQMFLENIRGNSSGYAIETNGLSKSYDRVKVVNDLNLRIPRNSIVGFLGPNGAGKTTTIKLLLGLIKPSSGGGVVFGHDIIRDNMEIRRHIGYLAQEPRYYECMTARETLMFKLRFYFSGPSSFLKKRVEDTLELVGLEDKADRPIKGFSGGEKQRLGIGQAQVHHPDLIILDEPAANLDPMGRRDVLDIMEGLRGHSTVFYSTHILDDVQRVSDTVAIMNKGELLAMESIDTLLEGGSNSYYLKVRGDSTRLAELVRAQPWVSGLSIDRSGSTSTLTIIVNNDEAAESSLPHLVMADTNLKITEFGRKRSELEDVFMNIVEVSNYGGK